MLAKKDIPNLLTYGRIACIPLIIAAFELDYFWLPLILFTAASLTDLLDGKLARQWGVESELGRLLDPNADKLLVAATLVMLCWSGFASGVAVTLILCRELFISGLREFMAERRITVHVTQLAKWKTASQMVAIITLLIAYGLGDFDRMHSIGSGLLWLATALTLITGAQYLRACLPQLKS